MARDADRWGLEPAERETYANGVRKATFRDPDGTKSDSAAIRPAEKK